MGRILVIRGGAVGDFILTLPAINLLKESLPDNELEILGYTPIISLAEAAGLAHKTRSIEHGALAAFFIPNGVLDPNWMEYFGSFNLIVSYIYDPDGFFHANLEKCGKATIIACSHRVEEPGDHAAIQLARPLEKLALFLDKPSPDLDIGSNGTGKSGQKRIVIHPGSGGKHKVWPTKNWISVAQKIASSRPLDKLVIVTGEAEEEHGTKAAMLEGLRGIPHDHLDSLALPQLAAELSECDLFLGHDSGISHLAAACGLPCVLLFGPTNPEVWAPKNQGVQVIQSPEGNLTKLATEDVILAAHQALI